MPFGFASSSSCCSATCGIGCTMLTAGGPSSQQRRHHPPTLLDRTRVAHEYADHRLSSYRLRHELERGCGDERDATSHLVRGLQHEVAPEPDQVAGHRGGVHQHRAEHDRPQGVQRERQLGDDPEVAAATTRPPEQVGVLTLGGDHEPTVGGDHLGRAQVVAGEPEGTFQPATSAAQGETGDTRGGHPTPGDSQPVRLGRGVHLAPRAPGPTCTRRRPWRFATPGRP